MNIVEVKAFKLPFIKQNNQKLSSESFFVIRKKDGGER